MYLDGWRNIAISLIDLRGVSQPFPNQPASPGFDSHAECPALDTRGVERACAVPFLNAACGESNEARAWSGC